MRKFNTNKTESQFSRWGILALTDINHQQNKVQSRSKADLSMIETRSSSSPRRAKESSKDESDDNLRDLYNTAICRKVS